ncbi:MAG: ATP-binding cassette domain-containing protein, partial [Sphingomonadales bacterium]|nr:ATP-binding cassette domain-containing protein [Sphingomonadales bacterium]
MPNPPPILSLNNVSKSFVDGSGTSTDVLDNISLDVADGEFVAILGFSGSGKTTLINCIAGLAEANSGEVLVKGESCKGPGKDRGLVFQ